MNSVVERSESFFPFDPEGAISNSLQVKELLVLRRNIPLELRSSFCKAIPNIIKVFASYLKQQLSVYDESSLKAQFAAANAEVAPLRRINASVINVLISMLFPANSVQAIEQRIENLIRTCRIYEISPETPVLTSSEGLNGPTLLVSYKEPRIQGVSLRAHVEKWTTRRETAGQLLYHNLIGFMNQGEAFTWVMPENYWFDFKRQKMESACNSIEMPKESESLKSSFASILNELSLSSDDDNVMVMERIQGGDLSDFARFKYPCLPDVQKKELFCALGQLSMLDLALGNCDRITKPSWLEGTPKFEQSGGILGPDPSNTGNMMYSENKEGKVFFYPIDNEIEEKSYSGEQSAAYLQFFQSTLQQIENLDPAEEISYLTTVIVKSLHRVFRILPNRGELKTFRKDLKQPWAQSSIERGIRTMVRLLKRELIKYWNSEESNALKKRLEAMNPELQRALDVRMSRCFLQNGCKKHHDHAKQLQLV